MKHTLKVLALAPCLCATGAAADGTWSLGLLVDGGRTPYARGSTSADLLPYIAYDTARLHIGVDEVSYRVITGGDFDLALMLTPRFSPDFPDTAVFDGILRDDAIEGGFTATYRFGATYAEFAFQGDISGVHNGFQGTLALGYEVELGPLALDLTAGVKLRDNKLNGYLFGVNPAEATADRAAFEMGNTANAFLGVTAVMPLSPNLSLVGQISHTDLGEAFNSPLVDRKSSTDMLFGVVYEF